MQTGDGDIDVAGVSADGTADPDDTLVWWAEQVAAGGTAWTTHGLGKQSEIQKEIKLADVRSGAGPPDGVLDIIAGTWGETAYSSGSASYVFEEVFIYTGNASATSGALQYLPPYRIAMSSMQPMKLETGDYDGDGDV